MLSRKYQCDYRYKKYGYIFFFYWRYNPMWVCILQLSGGAIFSSRTSFLNHTQRSATLGTTFLDELPLCRRDLYRTTHNAHNRQTSIPPVRFEPRITGSERPQTCALDRAATGIIYIYIYIYIYIFLTQNFI